MSEVILFIQRNIGLGQFGEFILLFLILVAWWNARKNRHIELPLGGRLLERSIEWLRQVGEKPIVALAMLSGLLICHLAFLYAVRHPFPRASDEFCYLLSAETYAAGRLTNPSPPFPHFFETLHTLVTPTYQAKYFPVQGMVLALGKVVFGSPIAGVWLSLLVAVWVLYWFLRQATSSTDAFVGALAFVLSGKAIVWWGMTFYGGALSMLGGLLVWACGLRLLKRLAWPDAVGVATGLLLLLNTRPFEGLFSTLPLLIYLGWKWGKALISRQLSVADWLLYVVVPMAIVLGVGLGLTLYYHYVVTQQPFTLTYTVYGKQYESVRSFLFQDPAPFKKSVSIPLDWERHMEIDSQLERRTLSGFLRAFFVSKLWFYTRFVFNFYFLIPFGYFLFSAKSALDKLLLATLFFLLAGVGISTFENFHYISPAFGVFFLVIVRGMQRMYQDLQPRGMRVYALIALGLALQPILGAYFYKSYTTDHVMGARPALVRDLESRHGKHLVFVRYRQGDQNEWVYNGADFQKDRIVWAHDLGAQNRLLIKTLPDRNVWLFEPDKSLTELKPYRDE